MDVRNTLTQHALLQALRTAPVLLPAQTLALWKTSWHLFVGALPFKLVNDAATFVGPTFLNLLLGVVSKGESSALGYTYAGLMFAGLVLGTLADNQHFQRVMRAGGGPLRWDAKGF